MKSLGQCSICTEKPANYNCSRCLVVCCSLPCYKSSQHVHEEKKEQKKLSSEKLLKGSSNETRLEETEVLILAPEEATSTKTRETAEKSLSSKELLFARVAADSQIKTLLSIKSLQIHLAVLLKLLEDSLLTNEAMAENRREIANMRLCELRMGGSEENLLIEEFVHRVLEVKDEIGH